MSVFSDDELVDFLLGLRVDGAIAAAVRGQADVRRRCRAMKTDLRGLDDEAARHILWEAQDTAADLIVIGASSRSRFAALRAPRVGVALLRGADRPVLVV